MHLAAAFMAAAGVWATLSLPATEPVGVGDVAPAPPVMKWIRPGENGPVTGYGAGRVCVFAFRVPRSSACSSFASPLEVVPYERAEIALHGLRRRFAPKSVDVVEIQSSDTRPFAENGSAIITWAIADDSGAANGWAPKAFMTLSSDAAEAVVIDGRGRVAWIGELGWPGLASVVEHVVDGKFDAVEMRAALSELKPTFSKVDRAALLLLHIDLDAFDEAATLIMARLPFERPAIAVRRLEAERGRLAATGEPMSDGLLVRRIDELCEGACRDNHAALVALANSLEVRSRDNAVVSGALARCLVRACELDDWLDARGLEHLSNLRRAAGDLPGAVIAASQAAQAAGEESRARYERAMERVRREAEAVKK